MRTSVGPLPTAVYWRRRAVVLGAVLLGIIVLFVSCSGHDKPGRNGKGSSASSLLPTPGPADGSADPEPSFLDQGPGGGPALPAPSDLETQPNGGGVDAATAAGPNLPGATAPAGPGTGTANNTGTGTGTGTDTNVTAPADGSCADSEISLIPIPSATTVHRGAPVQLSLRIKNIGGRTCSRDVGAGPQELYIDLGARKYWSSDTCSTLNGNDVRQFAPNTERVYNITWNGRESSSCAAGAAGGPSPPPGRFELRGRLGTLVSNPVVLTIVA